MSELEPDIFRRIVEGAPFGYIVFKPVKESHFITDFEVLYFSPGLSAYTGFRSENLQLGIHLFKVYPVQEKYLPILLQVLNSGRPYNETHYYFPSQTWLRVTVVPLQGHIMFVLENVTASVEQSELLQTVVEESLTPLLLLKAVRNFEGVITDFTVLLTNSANARYVNLPRERMIGARWADVFPDIYTTGMFQRAIEAADSGSPQRFTLPYQWKGERVWMDIMMVKHNDGVLLTFNDVTESVRYQQQLLKMTQALKQSDDNIHQFAFVASHDLQEPLRKIMSFSDILMKQYGEVLQDEGVKMLNRLQHSVSRMHSLVTDLLAYSRLTTRPAHLRKVNLNALLQNVLEDLKPVIERTHASLKVDDLTTVQGDSRQLYQLFENLLANALKFHQPGQSPRIVVRSEIVQRPLLEPAAFPAEMKTFLRIDVQDNGIGIEERHQDRIFGMFQRLHGAGRYAGTGVGLALCKKIAENHGGILTVKSTLNKGSTFSVFLPVT